MTEPPTIDHDPEEPPPDKSWKGIQVLAAIIVAVLWIGNIALFDLDWHSVALGALTGGAFVAILLEYTGNRVPRWMRH